MAAGFNTATNGIASAVTGAYSYIGDLDHLGTHQGTSSSILFQGATSSVYGSFNLIKTDPLGQETDGVASSIFGQANKTENANAAIIMGAGNQITNSYRDVDFSKINQSKFVNAHIEDIKDALGGAVKDSGGQVMAIGGGNTADYALQSQLMGVGNTLIGSEGNTSNLNYLEGFYNTAKNVQNAYIIGANNTVKNGSNNIVFGDKRTMDGRSGNIIIGSSGGDNSLETTVSKAIILGNKANATVEGGIAIGEGSIASTAAKVKGYDPSTGKETTETGEAWVSKAAAVSVGNSVGDTKITRQITNVAAGSDDTDAVNVAQLQKATDSAKTHYYSVNKEIPLNIQNGPYNYKNEGAVADASLAAGQNVIATGIASAATGAYSIIGDMQDPLSKSNTFFGLQGATAASYGSFNEILIDHTSGQGNPFDGVANSVFGQANKTQNANAAIIMGAGNTITNSYRDVDLSSDDTSGDLFEALQKAVPTSGGQVMAVGGGNKVENAYQSQVMGVGNTLTGVEGEYSEDGSTRLNYIEGFDNTIEGASQNAYIIGSKNKITDGKKNIIFGDNYTIASKDNNIVIGSADDAQTIDKADVVQIGHNAKVEKDGGVAIGEGSIASTAAGQVGYGYDPSSKNDKPGTWKATNAAVSVGDGTNVTRQITGVAAGTQDTDAVNVAQLKKVQDAINAKVDNDTKYTAGDNITIDGSNKISATDTNDTLVANDSALTLNGNTLSLEFKDTANNKVSGSVDLTAFKSAVDTNTTYTFDSTENDDNTTTLTVKGTDGTDQSVNVATKDTRNTLKAGDHISLAEAKQKDGSTEYTVSVKADGEVKSGNTGLITGGTVAKETRTSSDGFVTKKANTAGENISALDRQVKSNADNINNINQSVTNLGGRVDKLGSRINKVGAGAAALAALHPQDYDPSVKWDLAAGFGNYRDASAGAIGLFYRPNPDTQFSLGTNFGNGENMVNLGVTIKLGKGSQYAGLSRAALIERLDAQTKTIDTLRAKDADRDAVIAQQQQEIEALKAAVEKLMAKE